MVAGEVLDILDDLQQFCGKTNLDKEGIRDLKFQIKLMESGVSVEYRCPKCRDCSDCRNAPDTERISLREEAEDQAVKDSVHVDYKKKEDSLHLATQRK